jgi:cytochrome c553
MAYNPKTGLVYIPTQEIAKQFTPDPNFETAPIGWNLGVDVAGTPGPKPGNLLAWDPVDQREVWRVRYRGPWNGGVLTTAGNLVAQGDAAGNFNVYRADTGQKLWSTFAQSAIMGGPISYEVDGEQYIAVLSGWGSAFSLQAGKVAATSGNLRNVSRVLAFKVGGTAKLPPLAPAAKLTLSPPPDTADAKTIAAGDRLFGRFCGVCHGESAVGGGVVPDLRYSPFIAVDAWYSIVLDGALKEGGMAPFGSVLDRGQAAAILGYVIHRANEDATAGGAQTAHQPDPKRGAMIVAQGTTAGAPACAQCHAFTGGSDASGAFPRIAGQSAAYLSEQLRDFSAGVRANAVMTPIATALSPDDIADVAAYYASVETPFPPLATGDPDLVTKGQQLAEGGNAAKGIPGCSACHGKLGVGELPTVPYLAGQYAHYIAFELKMWQRGFRNNSPEAMRLLAKKLDDQEIAAVAAYYQEIRSAIPAAAAPKKD